MLSELNHFIDIFKNKAFVIYCCSTFQKIILSYLRLPFVGLFHLSFKYM